MMLHHKIGHDIQLVKNFDHSLPKIPAYPGELNQVWTNIIDNALQAMDGHGRLTFAGAHEEIVVLRAATGRCERVATPGPWVGATKSIAKRLVVSRLQLEPGDLLFLYTDGITEARNVRGEEFGMDRLCDAIEEGRDRPLDELCNDLFARVARWHVRQEDDQTAMAIRYVGADAAVKVAAARRVLTG